MATNADVAADIAAGKYQKSKFDEMTENTGASQASEERVFTPRVVYTSDAKIDTSKLEINRLRLAQGTTAEVKTRAAQVGQYVLTNFPAKDEVMLVPFGAQNIRFYQPDPLEPPTCNAPMGDIGIGDPGGVCKDCPMSAWGNDPKTGKRKPPACTEAVSLRAYSLTHKCLVDFTFDGRRAGKGAFIQQQAMAYGYANFVIRMTAETAKNDRNEWFEPKIEMQDEVPAELRDIVSTWYGIHLGGLVTTEQARLQIGAGN